MGTTANQKKLFFNLRKAKGAISALDEGDLRPDQVKVIATRLGVTEQDVVDMNRRLGGDGVRRGHVLEQLYREVRALRIYEGASDVQKVVIARNIS